MSRLIDADILKAKVPNTNVDIFENCRNCRTLMDWEVKELIDKQPTIDAVEVVHCKDCKYRYKMACHKAEFYECSHIGLTSETGNITHVGVTDDFFCADGERRET